MFGKNKREKLFKQLESASALPAYKLNKICGKIYALAQKGDGEAYYKLYLFAKDNYKNHDVDIKYTNWLRLLETAAELEYPEAVYEYYVRHGWGDASKRIAALSKVATDGNDKCCLALAHIYEYAYRDYFKKGLEKLSKNECAENVVKWLTPVAERGNVEAQTKLGKFLYYEQNDLDGATKWFNLAAEKGEEDAYIGLGRVYKKKGELYKAQKYFKIAADNGNAAAISDLGEAYLEPGAYQNVEKGIELLEVAAEKGNLYAPYCLSEVYKKGELVPQDLEKSEFWKTKYKELNDKILKENDEIEAQAEKDLAED